MHYPKTNEVNYSKRDKIPTHILNIITRDTETKE